MCTYLRFRSACAVCMISAVWSDWVFHGWSMSSQWSNVSSCGNLELKTDLTVQICRCTWTWTICWLPAHYLTSLLPFKVLILTRILKFWIQQGITLQAVNNYAVGWSDCKANSWSGFSLAHKILHFGTFSIKMTPKKLNNQSVLDNTTQKKKL